MDSPLAADELDLVMVFCDTEAEHWWNRFLEPGFRHCYALTQVQDGRDRFWLALTPQKGFTGIDMARMAPLSDVVLVPHFSWLHLKVKRIRYRHRVPHLLQPFTCVEQVKALAGISDPRVLTPKQLWRYCINGRSRWITTLDHGSR